MAPRAMAMAVLLVASTSAVRKSQREERSIGGIDGLYTFGAPGVATSGIKNKRSSDGCFPGRRTWMVRQEGPTALSYGLDVVVQINRRFDFIHPYLSGIELDMTRQAAKTKSCSEGLTDNPRSLQLKWDLHNSSWYAEYMGKIYNDLLGNLTYMTTTTAKELDPAIVAEEVKEKGWRLVGHAFSSGSLIFGGPQASHLLQHPETLECMVTFRGSMSTRDYLADADVRKSEFCGFEEEFHRGFRGHHRRMVRTEGWQNSIRAAMPSCSKLYSTGHSLGAATATLFAACTQNAPKPGEPGYDEDYSFIAFTKGSPSLLPEYMR